MKSITLALCLLLPALSAADIYKWTDEKGQVHYGEKPGTGTSESIAIPERRRQPATPAPDDKQRLENIKRWNAARQREREQARQKQAELQERKAKQKKRCNKLKNELADLQRGGVSWYRLDEAGQRQYMSDQQIEARKTRLSLTIRKDCR